MKSAFPRPVFLGSNVRTPIGKYGGSLKRFSAPELAGLALKECVARVQKQGATAETDWVFLGHARQAGTGPNPARQAVFGAGLGEKIPAITFNQACASGLTAVFAGVEKIALGSAENVYAGGVESMSNTPYFLLNARWGLRLGNSEVVDGMRKDGFFCPMSQMLMGETVDQYIAKELKISRTEQDAYAFRSQELAREAWSQGYFNEETFEIPGDGKNPGLKQDEHLRPDTTLESLNKLPPVFDPKNGTVTAGNSSGITDGAAFLHLSANRGPDTVAEVLDFQTVALDPRRMGLGPVEAIQKLLKRQGLAIDDVMAFEINEAFAAQIIGCQLTLEIPEERLNYWGGSIAIGHPIGASGARILVTLLSRLKGQSGALGVASLCVSGGQGVAILVRIV